MFVNRWIENGFWAIAIGFLLMVLTAPVINVISFWPALFTIFAALIAIGTLLVLIGATIYFAGEGRT